MIWSIAWKNIWRNKTRSLVVIIAATLGIISGVLVIGIMEGWVAQRLHDAVFNEVSHIQIHNSDFLKNEDLNLQIGDTGSIRKVIESLPGVKGWVSRTKIVAMAGTPWASTGIFVYGVDAEREKRVSEIWKKIVNGAGEYLSENQQGNILISDKTAEILKLKHFVVSNEVFGKLRSAGVPPGILNKLGTIRDKRFRSPGDFKAALKNMLAARELDRFGKTIMNFALDYRIRSKILLTLSDRQGTPVQGTFRVCGIYRTTNTGFDQSSAFVKAGDLAALYGNGEILVHEIAVLAREDEDLGRLKEKLSVAAPGITVNSWMELAPDAAMMNDFMKIYYLVFIGIILFALAFGIINTMMMTILERTRELGMLMAIGMNKKRIFRMIMLETIFLTSTGAIAGMLLGWSLVSVLGNTGIHFPDWGEGFEAIGFAATVYPVIKPSFFILIIIMVICTAVISSLWPARKALKLDPAEAIRSD